MSKLLIHYLNRNLFLQVIFVQQNDAAVIKGADVPVVRLMVDQYITNVSRALKHSVSDLQKIFDSKFQTAEKYFQSSMKKYDFVNEETDENVGFIWIMPWIIKYLYMIQNWLILVLFLDCYFIRGKRTEVPGNSWKLQKIIRKTPQSDGALRRFY